MANIPGKTPPEPRDTGEAESPRDAPVTTHNTGRVKFDDRGNAIWEWAVSTGKFAPIPSGKSLAKLENTALSLADDSGPPVPGLPTPKDLTMGYSPYDSVRVGKVEEAVKRPRKKDLRRLSEWLKLREQAARNKLAKD
jgi:hypothetical protein